MRWYKLPARWWWDQEDLPKTNVANVSWHKERNGWQVRHVDAETRKTKYKYFKGCDAWDKAVRHREKVQAVERKQGPGALKFAADGTVEAECSKCHRAFGIGSFAPEPCWGKKAFAVFAQTCVEIQSADPQVADAAQARLAVLPEGPKNEAIRRSKCRDVQHRTRMEGPNSNIAKCRAAGIEIRKDMAQKGCQLCMEDRAECLQCEHKDRLGKPKGCKSILSYDWYADKYGDKGPERMWEDYRDPHVVVLCMCCHAKASTHEGARGADSKTLETGSKEKKHREYVEAKYRAQQQAQARVRQLRRRRQPTSGRFLLLLRRLCGCPWGRARRPLGAQLRGDQELWHLRDDREPPVPKDGNPEDRRRDRRH